jgi:hypothetical protein
MEMHGMGNLLSLLETRQAAWARVFNATVRPDDERQIPGNVPEIIAARATAIEAYVKITRVLHAQRPDKNLTDEEILLLTKFSSILRRSAEAHPPTLSHTAFVNAAAAIDSAMATLENFKAELENDTAPAPTSG